jgi:hypothetical protein
MITVFPYYLLSSNSNAKLVRDMPVYKLVLFFANGIKIVWLLIHHEFTIVTVMLFLRSCCQSERRFEDHTLRHLSNELAFVPIRASLGCFRLRAKFEKPNDLFRADPFCRRFRNNRSLMSIKRTVIKRMTFN